MNVAGIAFTKECAIAMDRMNPAIKMKMNCWVTPQGINPLHIAIILLVNDSKINETLLTCKPGSNPVIVPMKTKTFLDQYGDCRRVETR